jgi:uncharacterized protein YkwD
MRILRRWFLPVVALLAAGSASLADCEGIVRQLQAAAAPQSAPQDEAAENALVGAINAYRASRGLQPLATHPQLIDKARQHATALASGFCGTDGAGTPKICHSSLAAGISAPYQWLGENVGMTGPPDVARMQQAFEQSSPHAANMLTAQATHIGVGVAYVNGLMYVAEEFMAL